MKTQIVNSINMDVKAPTLVVTGECWSILTRVLWFLAVAAPRIC